jgi:hypothetical protein
MFQTLVDANEMPVGLRVASMNIFLSSAQAELFWFGYAMA